MTTQKQQKAPQAWHSQIWCQIVLRSDGIDFLSVAHLPNKTICDEIWLCHPCDVLSLKCGYVQSKSSQSYESAWQADSLQASQANLETHKSFRCMTKMWSNSHTLVAWAKALDKPHGELTGRLMANCSWAKLQIRSWFHQLLIFM